MTDPQAKAKSPERPRQRIGAPFYPLTWRQAIQDYQDGLLSPRGLIYYYFAIALPPGAEMAVEVDSLCKTLGLHTATYYRAVGALNHRGRLNVRRGRMRVAIPKISMGERFSQPSDSTSQPSDSDLHHCDPTSQWCECQDPPFPNRHNRSRSSATVPETNRSFKPPNSGSANGPDINREGVATLLHLVSQAGINPNKTIQTALEQAIERNPAAARQAVENALSALQEQRDRGNVRNPGGLFVAALRGSYTANGEKRRAKMKRQSPQEPSPPDLIQTSLAIDIALEKHDRPFVHAKLQQLWSDGWHDQVEELLQLRKDWKFQVIGDEVRDGSSI